MNNNSFRGVTLISRVILPLITCIALLGANCVHAGITFVLDMYRVNQGQSYVFYTPLTTNAIGPAAPLGTYVITSPGWPTNGSSRGFEMTTNGLVDVTAYDSEWAYA